MIVRSVLHINGQTKAQNLYAALQETFDHLLLKLAASLFYFDLQPSIESGATHAALQGQEYWPDVMSTDEAGQVRLWVECGKTTLHKLAKVSKRYRDARIVVLTAEPHQARQQAEGIIAEGLSGIEVWSFAEGEFDRWRRLAGEKNEIIGEATPTSLNLVLNDEAYVTDLQRHSTAA
ncbi:MAG TPA: YaeQ family protein [Elusimicrobiota bacterium]|nr:YaeQ family protein [Elusimicrobiota bacterium]